jgi:dienelactone hydrolase
VRWIGEPTTGKGVVERRFDLDVSNRTVPGVVWTPEAVEGPRPIVLVGHGASLHKRVSYVLAVARMLVRRHGIAAVAIDGPNHGDRRPDPDADPLVVFSEFPDEWSRPGSTDEMVEDWLATLAAVRALPEIGDGPIGYWGLSMGSIFGIPLVAAEPRIQVAVLGLLGLSGPTKDRLAADAAKISCPVLYLLQWDDQLFARDKVIELYDRLGSLDKRLHAHPGEHSAVPPEEIGFSVEFLARYLLP